MAALVAAVAADDVVETEAVVMFPVPVFPVPEAAAARDAIEIHAANNERNECTAGKQPRHHDEHQQKPA